MMNNIEASIVTENNICLVIDMWHRIFPDEELRVMFGGRNCFEESLITNDLLKYYIHYDSGIPVGISGIYTEPAEPESAWLGWFGVLPEYRRKKYGTEIIDFFLNQAKEFGFKYVRLYTGVDNVVGRQFYENNGFFCGPYISGPEDIVIYSRSLCDRVVPLWSYGIPDTIKYFSCKKI